MGSTSVWRVMQKLMIQLKCRAGPRHEFLGRSSRWRLARSGLRGWFRNSIAANLLMAVLLIGGIWTAFNIQKEVFPQFELDIVEISVGYPGAAPEEVEQGILRPIEESRPRCLTASAR